MELLDLYHRLPYPARCLAASLRGRQLARRRYSSETPRLVAEALERETWSGEQWSAWQEETLPPLLHRAATRVPFYREQWARRRAAGDRRSWDRLEHWPILHKETLRRQPEAFLADDCDARSLVQEHTSGSTGSPLRVWRSEQSNIAWYALVEARQRRWHGLHRQEPWAILGGQLVAPVDRMDPPYWVWCGSQKQLYLSAYHLAPGSSHAYCSVLRKHRIRSLLGYPSGLAALASLALEEGASPPTLAPPLAVVLGNAEPLFDHQRKVIQQAFGAPVRDTYGLAEMTAAASECPHGSLHRWPEVGVLELLEENRDAPVHPGEAGRVVTTGLLNEAMPLIRYEVGDRATAPGTKETCTCGRTLPRLASIEGRLDDVIVTPDGRRVGRLDPIFKGDLPIREAQIVQIARDRLVMRIVPAAGFGEATAEDVAHRLRQRVGRTITVTTELVEALPRTRGGKVRAVLSLLEETP